MESRDDLRVEELEQVLVQLPIMDAVRLTGGEPFVRRDFEEVARLVELHLQPLVLHVTTNGFLTDRIVEWIEERETHVPLQLLISVDGTGAKHNQIRGNSNAWSSVLKTIHHLAPLQQQRRFQLGVNQTIVDDEGVEHYRRLHRMLVEQSVNHYVVLAYRDSATYNLDRAMDVAPRANGEYNAFGEFSEGSLQRLLDGVERDLSELPFPERVAKRYYLHGIRNRLFAGAGKPNPLCVALNAHLRILPNGDVPTCQLNGRCVGNLRHQRFEEVWRSNTAVQQRQWVADCPGCWAECEVLPSALYTLDVLRALV
jgi:MoaA/NifB/PqqE/SkfB family radical SAM enzyme